MAENVDDFVAGWVSGVAGLALTQPIDFVLTRLQTGNAAKLSGGAMGTGVPELGAAASRPGGSSALFP